MSEARVGNELHTPHAGDPPGVERPRRQRRRWWLWALLALLLLGAVAALLLRRELHTSHWQAREIHRYAATLRHHVAPGAAEAIQFPLHGPFDERLGYTEIPGFLTRLRERGFEVTAQSRQSEALREHMERGWFAPYAEKTRAGLTVLDCNREPMHAFRYPFRHFEDFESVPPVLVQTLLFIENRDLLDPTRPEMNPAVDWLRFTRAVIAQVGSRINPDIDAHGSSTLATQIEKYRHSPDGITHDVREKLRQMASASVRAYQQGTDTLPPRRQLVLDYLNTVPLSAAPRHGEVHGLGDGLWVWFGTDFERARAALSSTDDSPALATERAVVLRQAVALMIAHRRPSWYLAQGRAELDSATDAHLRLLADAGLIDSQWRDDALRQRLVFRDMVRDPPLLPTTASKGTSAVRTRLASLLGSSLYSLDRLDADAGATLDGKLQEAVSTYLGRLDDPAFARSQGLMGERLLQPGNLGEVHYSFTLLERTPQGNLLRTQTDTTQQPLDINEGSKLELGSTAKLRVLATYLERVAELHARLAPLPPEQLRATETHPQDSLSRWAVQHLLAANDRSLDAMLDAAMERRFSASPNQAFFTGGGLHTFHNFNRSDDARSPSLREAMQASINLPFVRLLREIVQHTLHQDPDGTARLLSDRLDPRREAYLARFADREGKVFLRRFWRKTDQRSPDELRALLFDGLRPGAERLAAVFRYLDPEASPEALASFLALRLGEQAPDAARVALLHQRYAPEAMDLPDRGYVARVHPLELWLVAYRLRHPEATLEQANAASAAERQAVYRWLFRTRAKDAQDNRIYTMLEVEAFLDIHRRWARLGYPFGHLVPSLATALGSSGDRPAALAELMGIIVNGGVRLPTHRIADLRLASGTPWETALRPQGPTGEQVMAPEVARALRKALSEVVEAGTARRLAGSFRTRSGEDLSPGGKTGTGDNRVVVGGRGGTALNRTATFVFFLGPRHFGTITAYVVGPHAADHRFTSGLPVQILRSMGPVLLAHLDGGPGSGCRREP
ncbi:transglycosylase domain-containing protein [Hydrogenophaga sp. BPS33]|uniref:transglycosylase domain-containing protein n=1 Tax=Hydrogenophaga sp. BPS33 TaxID=2651974 RepID=UPI0013201356|nr:transglycosylase domain-containing protein [Hydrogenophaga sp. BPS33]QHE87565.1 penicillin-binding protein [Hydrogenophaga sp. BPS33]